MGLEVRVRDGSVLELDAQGRVVAIRVDGQTWDCWDVKRLERAARSHPTRAPRPSRLDQLEAENAELRAEVHRLRDLADAFATMLAAQAEPCPCFAGALKVAA